VVRMWGAWGVTAVRRGGGLAAFAGGALGTLPAWQVKATCSQRGDAMSPCAPSPGGLGRSVPLPRSAAQLAAHHDGQVLGRCLTNARQLLGCMKVQVARSARLAETSPLGIPLWLQSGGGFGRSARKGARRQGCAGSALQHGSTGGSLSAEHARQDWSGRSTGTCPIDVYLLGRP
jgi:hypothetical protein